MWRTTKLVHRAKKSAGRVGAWILTMALMISIVPAQIFADEIAARMDEMNIVDAAYHAMKDGNVIDKSVARLLDPYSQPAKAADFTMQTGYFVGTGTDNLAITGLGFQPDFVMIKDNTAGGTDGVNFKTSAMSGEVSSVLGDADADTATNAIQSFDSDGFTLGTDADVNSGNVGYTWQAFGGSDCSASGTFCVGSYTGDGTAGRSLNIVGFQPDFLLIKRSGATSAVFKTATMATNNTTYFDATAQITGNTAIRTLDATGFTLGNGAQVNTSANTYYFVAFKAVANKMATGTYSGNGADNRSIAGFGSGVTPDFVFTKSTSTQSAVYNVRQSGGDFSYDFIDAIGAIDQIQALQADGFQVGTNAKVNANGVTFHWVGFGGNPDPPSASYDIQTGYYVGNAADNRQITGVGFRPDLLLVKSNTTATTTRWKAANMVGEQTVGTVTTPVNTNQLQTLDSDGFTLGSTTVNNANVVYNYIALKGSDCSASGEMCVGLYPGNGVSGRAINSVGFEPDFVMIKSMASTAAAVFKTSAMGANVNQYLAATAETTDGSVLQGLTTTGFTVGNATNTNAIGVSYMFIAFKAVTDQFNVGSYTGNGADNRNITGFGSGSVTPSFAFIKGTGAVSPVGNIRESYGDYAMHFAAAAGITNSLQGLIADGFQVGNETTTNTSNTNGSTYHWVAFGGAAPPPTGSGDFVMDTGTYTANNSVGFNVTGLDFAPDLVVIKGNNTQVAVFRTRMMGGDTTAHMSNSTANFTGGITALNSDGFSIGASTIVNPANTTDVYHWQAFGNAFRSDTRSGASNFAIGAYSGNGLDNRDIAHVGIDPDFVTIKRSGASPGAWATTTIGSDNALAFAATVNTANIIQSFSSDGFQVGSNSGSNSLSNVYWWFAFKETDDQFDVGVYRGNGADNRSITSVGFQPDLVWTKKYGATARAAALRPSDLAGDSAQQFTATANAANKIQALEASGFQVGTDTSVNENGATTAFDYYYAAWKIPSVPSGSLAVDIVDAGGNSVASPAIDMEEAAFSQFSCQNTDGVFGTVSERIRISNSTANPSWSLSLAAQDGESGLWNGGAVRIDFNDPGGSGCTESDGDTYAGQMSVDPSTASIDPEVGCDTTGLSLGSLDSFEGASPINLLTAGGSAGTDCYWDLTEIDISQTIPAGQDVSSYVINVELTITAS